MLTFYIDHCFGAPKSYAPFLYTRFRNLISFKITFTENVAIKKQSPYTYASIYQDNSYAKCCSPNILVLIFTLLSIKFKIKVPPLRNDCLFQTHMHCATGKKKKKHFKCFKINMTREAEET